MGPLTMRRLAGIAAAFTLLALISWPAFAEGRASRLDRVLSERAGRVGTSRVIVRGQAGPALDARLRALGARIGSRLQTVDAVVADVPNAALDALAADSAVVGLHFDRPIVPMLSSGGASGSRGRADSRTGDYDGTGVGVAIIDSGITDWHDDLARTAGRNGLNGQRVSGLVDFVGGAPRPRDGYGHGTHVAGIIAGDGFDADGAYAGVAPGAQLLILKVLDDQGRGTVSDVLRAIDFAVANRARFRLRIINLSIGAAVL